MAKQVPWNKIIVDEFEKLGCLTDEEKDILESRVKGWTVTQQSMEFNMSTAKVNSIIKRLKIKYDNVQQHSYILPPRRFSVKETYMDTH